MFLLLTCASVLLASILLLRRRSPLLPPGPKGLPLLGNVFDLPKSHAWLTFAELGKKYGDIIYLNALGHPLIILNSSKHVTELLEKKSKIYSNRPTLMMAGSLVGWEQGPALIQYGKTWSDYRRLFSQFMGTRQKVEEKFHELFAKEVNKYLKNILEDPKGWAHHTKSLAGVISLLVTYGYRAQDKNERLIQLVNEAIDAFSETTAANAYLVDVFPLLRFVPSWFPGASWKRKAIKYNKTLHSMLQEPYEWVKQNMSSGTAKTSFVSEQLLDQDNSNIGDTTIQWAAAGVYSGAADTVVAGIECFFLALARHSTAQVTAQNELSRVLGPGVLPSLSDRGRLPYVEALYNEVIRMYNLGPLGVPHAVSENDVYEGYLIPKGSIIFTNVYQFFRDPETYNHPEMFSPERFIGDNMEKDPKDYLFGFGRRKCPGHLFADSLMWLTCASVLASFDIRPLVINGREVVPEGKFFDGTISHPEPFESNITPRPGAAEAIRAASS